MLRSRWNFLLFFGARSLFEVLVAVLRLGQCRSTCIDKNDGTGEENFSMKCEKWGVMQMRPSVGRQGLIQWYYYWYWVDATFVFLLIQRRIFQSYYFHVRADLIVQMGLSSRATNSSAFGSLKRARNAKQEEDDKLSTRDNWIDQSEFATRYSRTVRSFRRSESLWQELVRGYERGYLWTGQAPPKVAKSIDTIAKLQTSRWWWPRWNRVNDGTLANRLWFNLSFFNFYYIWKVKSSYSKIVEKPSKQWISFTRTRPNGWLESELPTVFASSKTNLATRYSLDDQQQQVVQDRRTERDQSPRSKRGYNHNHSLNPPL